MLNKLTLTLIEGACETLTATVLPDDAENKAVTWSSSNGAVANVDRNGKVTAVNAGEATITVTTADGGKTAACAVTVQATDDPPKTMTMTAIIEGEMDIVLAGTGTAVIDWSDGSMPETVNLTATGDFFTHTLSGATSRTITITGQNVTRLACARLSEQEGSITSLDVSNNTALTSLQCDGYQLTSIDVSRNTKLTYLQCASNQLTSIDVSNNTALTYLHCGDNQLTSIDVSNNTALTGLTCGWNQLTELDVSSNTALTGLDCNWNQLTELDVSSNTALTYLSCYYNQLTVLNMSNNTALTQLYCDNNQLTALDVSNNTALTELYCMTNQLPFLNVSSCTALTLLYCADNQLTSLDVSKNTALATLWCMGNQLTDTALNALFGTLHSNTIADGKRIYIHYNPGTATCDWSIATNKGWAVMW